MKKLPLLLPLICLASFATQAEVRINGFANLIAGVNTSDKEIYNYSDKVGFSSESLFALQISGDINDRMTATGQIVARAENDYEATFEWAYLSYQATDNLNIKAGRFRIPFFRYSASKDVSYSYHWVTAPRSVYNIAFNNLDGVSLDYSDYAGDWEYNFVLNAGTYASDLAGGRLSGNDTVVLSAEATRDWFKLRVVTGRASASFSDAPAFDGILAQIDSFSPELSELLAVKDDTGIFMGLGIEADMFDWFASAEITSIDQKDSFAGLDVAYYVTAGLRLGKWTPSATYERFDGTRDGLRFTDFVSTLDPSIQPIASVFNTAIQATSLVENARASVGVRYDYDTNVALKADVSSYKDYTNDDNSGTLVRVGINYVF